MELLWQTINQSINQSINKTFISTFTSHGGIILKAEACGGCARYKITEQNRKTALNRQINKYIPLRLITTQSKGLTFGYNFTRINLYLTFLTEDVCTWVSHCHFSCCRSLLAVPPPTAPFFFS